MINTNRMSAVDYNSPHEVRMQCHLAGLQNALPFNQFSTMELAYIAAMVQTVCLECARINNRLDQLEARLGD